MWYVCNLAGYKIYIFMILVIISVTSQYKNGIIVNNQDWSKIDNENVFDQNTWKVLITLNENKCFKMSHKMRLFCVTVFHFSYRKVICLDHYLCPHLSLIHIRPLATRSRIKSHCIKGCQAKMHVFLSEDRVCVLQTGQLCLIFGPYDQKFLPH